MIIYPYFTSPTDNDNKKKTTYGTRHGLFEVKNV